MMNKRKIHNKSEEAIFCIKKFLKDKGFILDDILILYGQRAAEFSDHFCDDNCAILIIYPPEYKMDFDEYYIFFINPLGTVTQNGPSLTEQLIHYLGQNNIHLNAYDYLDECSIILYSDEHAHT